jgi:hypothetical protein
MSTANFKKMTLSELKEFALENKVDLEGAKLKNDIIKKLKNYKPSEDCGCGFEKRDNEKLTPDESTIEPEKTYPDCFEICGYAKELYDANRGSPAFNMEKFKDAMDIYSHIFCFERDLRDDRIKGYTSIEGMKALLEGSRETTTKLLEEVGAKELEKNTLIWDIHTKNILALLNKQ